MLELDSPSTESMSLNHLSRLRSDDKEKGRRDKNQPRWKTNREQASQIRPRDRNTVHLDGSTLEGGGQLVRVALTLSAITGIPVHVKNIRAGRGGGLKSGGLKESHLAALEALAEECSASVEGAHVGSKELLFEPTRQRQDCQPSDDRKRTIALEKQGSVWLILQALLPWYLLQKGRTELTLKGGTNVSSSMSCDYVQQVLLPVLEKINLPKVKLEVVQRGWAGNTQQIGEAKVTIEGDVTGDANAEKRKSVRAFDVLDRGAVSKIAITIVAHPESMRSALAERATEQVSLEFPNIEVEIAVNEDSHDVRRLYILLVAQTSNGWRLGRDYLGTGKALKGQKETDALIHGAVRTATDELLKEVEAGGCVDEYMQDQLVVFQALAAGVSAVDAAKGRGEGTLHTQTVRWVCQEMLGKLGFEVMKGGACFGIGTNASLANLDNLHTDARFGKGRDIDKQLAEAVGQMTCDESNE